MSSLSTILTLPHVEEFKLQLLFWADQFNNVCILDSHEKLVIEQEFHFIAAIDSLDFFSIKSSSFSNFENWIHNKKEYVFGHLNYDLYRLQKEFYDKSPPSKDEEFGYFFEPRYLIKIIGNKIEFNRNYPESIELMELVNAIAIPPKPPIHNENKLVARKSKSEYIQDINFIKNEIENGTFYELNYCMEWFDAQSECNPIFTFYHLNKNSKAPFSSFLKIGTQYTMCASPERFLKKKGNQLISQPIKGTIKRDHHNKENDLILKNELYHSLKERAENIMIVDLVRHDLTPYAKTGSIEVTELFGIYSFKFVHQMISTIKATLLDKNNGIKALLYAFPPGSMTGAPKHEVILQIEKIEPFQRGIFSGSIGYIDPEGDYDFNVVIRSIFYNSDSKYLSIKSGGAITYESNPEAEYDECILKASSLIHLLFQS